MKSASPAWRVGVDPEAAPVDHDVVMEPAQRGEVGVVVVPERVPFSDVVWLQAIGGTAAIDSAQAAVPGEHVAAGLG